MTHTLQAKLMRRTTSFPHSPSADRPSIFNQDSALHPWDPPVSPPCLRPRSRNMCAMPNWEQTRPPPFVFPTDLAASSTFLTLASPRLHVLHQQPNGPGHRPLSGEHGRISKRLDSTCDSSFIFILERLVDFAFFSCKKSSTGWQVGRQSLGFGGNCGPV